MSESPKTLQIVRNGSLSIAVKQYADRRIGFDYVPPGEERKKVRLRSLKDAVERAKEMVGAARAGRVERLAIDPNEYASFLRWQAERRGNQKVPDVLAAFLQSKEQKGRSEKHLRDLRELEKFGQHFNCMIGELTRGAVEEWLNCLRKRETKEKIGARRWNNIRDTIIALFRFARREGILGADLTSVETIERRKTHSTIHTFAPDELTRLLAAAPDRWVPVVVLGAFAGIRPEEVAPDPKKTRKPGLRWEHILWDKKKIDVPKEVAKGGRRRRFAPLLPAAIDFLRPWRNARGPIAPERGRLSDQYPPWCRAAGIEWKHDILRHSFASYRLAITEDLPALALEMGNSVGVIFESYLDLKHEDEAEQWFALRPKRPANVIVA